MTHKVANRSALHEIDLLYHDALATIAAARRTAEAALQEGIPLRDLLALQQRAFITVALRAAKGNKSLTARRLKIHRNTLVRLMR